MMPAEPHRHLDDDTLSGVLDGEASPEEGAAAARCDTCSARLVRLRQVAQAVGGPTPFPDAARRRAMIDAALRAEEPEMAAPTVLATRRPRRVAPAWAAAAAVIAAGALAVPRLVDREGGVEDQEQAAGDPEATADPPTAGAGDASVADPEAQPGGEESALAARPPPGRDLGEIDLDRLEELAAALRQDFGREQPLELTSPGVAPAAERLRPGAGEMPAGARPDTAVLACEEAARRRDAALGPLVYAARASVEGRPVIVFAFEVATSETPPSPRLFILAADDCSELAAE